jgi:23S rRNA (uracil1939-C5)-methyltransferase
VLLNIEKLIYGGDGLARHAPDATGRGKAAFVPFVLEGEQVEADITEERPGFVRARANAIVQGSPERIEPRCPYFARCGGCHYQHTNYAHQLEIKRDILVETLRRTAKLELPCELNVVSAEPWHFRNRTRLKVRTSPDFAIGYFRHASHELLPVRECPISSPLLNRAIAALWALDTELVRYPELREVQLFANHADDALLLELHAARAGKKMYWQPLADALANAVPELIGTTVFEYAPARDGDEDQPVASRSGAAHTYGAKSMEYAVGEHRYRVSAGSFFQTNRYLSEKLVSLVSADYAGKNAVDLFAGTGLFSLPLASKFVRVTSVEASSFSGADLRVNAEGKTIKAVERDAAIFLDSAGGQAYDLVVVDPPRAGLGERTARKLARLKTARIVYVSCDPSTLARDLRVLMDSEFRVTNANFVDLFPQTFHMESVFHLAR